MPIFVKKKVYQYIATASYVRHNATSVSSVGKHWSVEEVSILGQQSSEEINTSSVQILLKNNYCIKFINYYIMISKLSIFFLFIYLFFY